VHKLKPDTIETDAVVFNGCTSRSKTTASASLVP